MKISRLALLLIFLCSTAQAQTELPPKGKYKHDKKIESSYDKFKDQTTVSVKYLSPLPALSPVRLDIVAAFLYPGKTVTKPSIVALWFQSSSKNWQFLQQRQLLVIADGERIDLGEAERVDSKVNSSRAGRYSSGVSVSELVGKMVSLETFLKIAKAKSVEMRLGSVEFKLADDHLEALRDFASRMSSE